MINMEFVEHAFCKNMSKSEVGVTHYFYFELKFLNGHLINKFATP